MQYAKFCYCQTATHAVYHASTTVLRDLDLLQERFLRQLDVSEVDAFLTYILAPLRLRRDVAMLGIIHRASMRQGPPALWQLIRRCRRIF